MALLIHGQQYINPGNVNKAGKFGFAPIAGKAFGGGNFNLVITAVLTARAPPSCSASSELQVPDSELVK